MKTDKAQHLLINQIAEYLKIRVEETRITDSEYPILIKFQKEVQDSKGLCYGLSIVHASMFLPVAAQRGLPDWWDDLLTHITDWNGEKDSLENLILLKNAESTRPLREIFDLFINMVFFNHGINDYHPALSKLTQSKIKNHFQILLPNNDKLSNSQEILMKVNNHHRIGGNFSEEILQKILDDEVTKKFIEKNITFISGLVHEEKGHGCSLRYQQEKGWFFHDPNYSIKKDFRIDRQEIFFISTQELVKEIISKIGKNLILNIWCLSPTAVEEKEIDKPFSLYYQILEKNPLLLLEDLGLEKIMVSEVLKKIDIENTIIQALQKEFYKLKINNHSLILITAIGYGHNKLAHILINNGANLNYKDSDDCTVLHYTQDLETINCLLEHKIEVNSQNNSGITPLIKAVISGNIPIVKLLLDHGANVNMADKKGCSALMMAVRQGHIDIVNLLLKKSNIDYQDLQGNTSLMWAVKTNNINIVNILIDESKINHQDLTGCSSLMWAANHGFLNIVQALLSKGSDPNLTNNSGFTALMLATCINRIDIVNVLLSAGAKIDFKDKAGNYAISHSAQRGHREITQLFTDISSKESKDDNFFQEVKIISAKNDLIQFQFFISQKDIKLLFRMLEKNPELIDTSDTKGNTLLMLAVQSGDIKSVTKLMSHQPGPTLEIKNKSHQNAMQLAAINGHFEICKLLFQNSDEKNNIELLKTIHQQIGNQDYPLLHWAIINLKAKSLTWLLENSPTEDIIKIDFQERTALMVAVIKGDAEKIRILIKNSSIQKILNTSNSEGSALSMAVRSGRLDIVKILVEGGALLTDEFSTNINFEIINRIHYPMISYLFEKGLIVDKNLLELALKAENFKLINLLIESALKMSRSLSRAPFTELKESDYFETAKTILNSTDFPKDPALDFKSAYALITAVKLKNARLVNFLLKNGAYIHQPDMTGVTAWSVARKLAAENPIAKIIFYEEKSHNRFSLEQLLKIFDDYKETPAYVSRKIPDPNWPFADGNTALHMAVQNKYYHMIKILIENSAKFLPNRNQQTPLHLAVDIEMREINFGFHKYPLIMALLNTRQLQDLDTEDNHGKTAIYYVAAAGNIEIVKLLQVKGADCTQVILFAATHNKPELVEAIIRDNKHVSEIKWYKFLETAITNKNWKVARTLANMNEQTCRPGLLFFVAENKQTDLVKLIIKKGGDYKSAIKIALESFTINPIQAKSALLLLINSLSKDQAMAIIHDQSWYDEYRSVKFLTDHIKRHLLTFGITNNFIFKPNPPPAFMSAKNLNLG